MEHIFSLEAKKIKFLHENPEETTQGALNSTGYKAKIMIKNFRGNVHKHYQTIIQNCQDSVLKKKIPPDFQHFGLLIEFEDPLELSIYDLEKNILGNVKDLIHQFGIVIFNNVYMNERQRKEGHTNRFPHLHFHRDRNMAQSTVYSLFCRNPFDPIQKKPRLSSTLFTTSMVAYLQSFKENGEPLKDENIIAPHYDIFKQTEANKTMDSVFNSIILEHTWTAPEGTGELTIMDNRRLVHASYYRHIEKGYRIGVRYLK